MIVHCTEDIDYESTEVIPSVFEAFHNQLVNLSFGNLTDNLRRLTVVIEGTDVTDAAETEVVLNHIETERTGFDFEDNG